MRTMAIVIGGALRTVSAGRRFLRHVVPLINGRNNSTGNVKEDALVSPFADVEIPDVSLPEYIFQEFDKWATKVAIECSVNKIKYTFDEVRLKSRNFAKFLRNKLKLQKGDTFAILLPNVPQFAIVALGGYQAGVVATTINPLYTPEEIARQLIDSDAKAIVTLNVFFKTARDGAKLAKKNIPIITVKMQQSEATEPGSINFAEIIDAQYDKGDFQFPSSDDVAFLPYSSGTTGLPKGVQLTHRNMLANLCQASSHETAVHLPTTDSFQDVTPAVLPLFHIYGHTMILLYSLRFGIKSVTLPKFTPELYTSVLRDYKPTMLMAVPPIVTFLTTSPMVKKEYFESVRVFFSGAAPLGALDEIKFLQKVEKEIHLLQGYGLSETSPVVSLVTPARKRTLKCYGSVGNVVPNTRVKIVSPDDPTKHLKPNEKGEILVKGPQVMKGYHNKPKETAETFVGEWLRTGDLGHYDENELIYVTERLKELIKVKGFQVAPAELEELLRDYPDVEDAAVIGIPNDNYGEVPRAYVVPKKGRQVSVDKLNEYLASKVASYKLLRGGVAVVDSVPKNAAGKIMRRQLKEMYAREKK